MAGALLRFLAAAIGARTVVEIGTGCGSSGIWLLRGMRPDAVLTSVDVEPEHQRMARKAFAEAGFAANQYRLILGRALDVLPRLSDGAYDLVFCDADSREYPDYLEAALRLLRVGGIVAFDDVVVPVELAGAGADGAAAGRRARTGRARTAPETGWARRLGRPGSRPGAGTRRPDPRRRAAHAALPAGRGGHPRRRTAGLGLGFPGLGEPAEQ